MKLLVEHGADFNVTTASGVNALHMAAQGNSALGVNVLLNDFKGYDLN